MFVSAAKAFRKRARPFWLHSCDIFEIRTLKEAEQIAAILALNYPDPSLAGMGIWELVANAVEHGSLEINMHEKRRLMEAGIYEQEVERRQAREPFASRLVRIELRRFATHIGLLVVDDGPGFDHHAVLAREPDGKSPCGRGVRIATGLGFWTVHYLGRGNVVYAVARVGAGAPQAEETT